jgi:serine/threonine-protein kinase
LETTIGGRYALCAEIASGGMATVHLARQIGAAGFSRWVAVKRAHERFSRDPEFVAMFLDEARLVARIRHPNVVQTIDVVAEHDELFIVMEYVHGESLLRIAQTAKRRDEIPAIAVTAAIVAGALHGLHDAHEARSETGEPLGIVHRDVSPHNILVGVDGVPRVLDFGVAKASQRITTTQEGQLKGKLSYMAPEQVANGVVDRRTDVYAAAVVLWEALTGAKLFQGGNEAAVIQSVMLSDPRPPSAYNRLVSPALDDVVMHGLHRDPSRRFATARDMALALEHATTIATASEVGAYVSTVCVATLTERKELIARIESRTSTDNLQHAVDSLRALSSGKRSASSGAISAVKPGGVGAPFGSVPSMPPAQALPPPPAMPSYSSMPVPDASSAPPARVQTYPPDGGLGTNAAMQLPPAAPARAGRALAIVAVLGGLVLGLAVLGGVLVWKSRARGATAIADASPTIAVAASSTSAAATPPACPDGMVGIPGGRFFMGSDDDRADEKPAHKVTLDAYCMDRWEVTTDAYKSCSDRGDCKRAATSNKWDGITSSDSRAYDPLCNASDASKGKHPINCVDWMMADRFCKADGKRLPTEAEWEFAARGSDGRKYPWGDQPPSAKLLNACGKECVGWGRKHAQPLESMYGDDDGFATTAPVGSFPLGASRWGVEDVVGNVWEWTSDWYGPYGDADVTDPSGPPTGTARVIRGGAWNGAQPDWVRPSFRFRNGPDTRSHGIGFRCAKTL